MESFYVDTQSFEKAETGLYVGRWFGPKVDNRFINLHLGNPFVIVTNKVSATLALIDDIQNDGTNGGEWLKRCCEIRKATHNLPYENLVCHCQADNGCHAWLIAALFNSHEPEKDVIAAHRAKLEHGQQMNLFGK